MSASKKKRMGSQRRALNAQESPENSDKATNPPVPQGRQRADAKADLTLSPDSEKAETSVRKKKLGSQRGNKGKLQFKDVTSESGQTPIEEVEGSTAHPDVLGIKNENIDESLERSVRSTIPEIEAREDTTSDTLVNVPIVEKYLEETPSSEEGVLSEKDQEQQMPDITETMMPSGVILTEHQEIKVIGSHDHNNKHSTESKAGPIEKPVCQESDTHFQPTAKSRKMGSSRKKKVMDLKESQDKDDNTAALEATGLTMVDSTPDVYVSATGVTYTEEGQEEKKMPSKINEDDIDTDYLSHVENANLSEVTEVEGPHILAEMKVHSDQIDETKLSDNNLVSLQNQDLSELLHVEMPLTGETGLNTSHLWVTDLAVVDVEEADATDEDNQQKSKLFSELQSDIKLHLTTDETISELQEPMLSIQPENQPSTEELLNLHENKDYNFDDAAAGSVAQTASSSVCMTPENKSLVEFADSSVNIIEQPERLINLTEGLSTVPDEVCKGEGQDKDVNLSNEMVQQEERVDSVDNLLLSAPDVGVNDEEEAKILQEEEISSQLVCEESLLQHDKSNTAEESLTAAAEVQEPITESDALDSDEQDSSNSASTVMSDSASESSSSAEDETVEPMSGAAQGRKPSAEEMLFHNIDEISISTTSEFIGAHKKETDVDAHPIPSSSLSEMPENNSSSSLGLTELDKTNIEDENIHQSEPLVSSADTVNSDSNEPVQEENQDMDIHTDTAACVDDLTAIRDVPSEKLQMNTSKLSFEEIQVDPESIQSPEMSLDLKDQTTGLESIDSADKKDFKYTSKADEEIRIVDLKDVSDTQQSIEQPVSNETIGEPFVDKEDALSAENENLPISANFDFVLSEADKDKDGNQQRENYELQDQQDEAEPFSAQIPYTDAIHTTLATTQQEASVGQEDGSAASSQVFGNRRKLGSSRRIKGRRQDNDELPPEEISIMPDRKIINIDTEIEEKSQEVIIGSEIVPDKTKVEPIQRPEIAKDYEIQAAAPAINYHQLTFSLDSESHEEMDNSALRDVSVPVLEETVGGKMEVFPRDSKDIVYNDNEAANQVSELGEFCSAEKMSTDFESEFQAEQINQGIVSKPEHTEDSLQTDKDQTDDSMEEKDFKTQSVSHDEKTVELQSEVPEVVLDSFIINDLNDKGVAEVEHLPRDVDLDNTNSQPVARTEENISTAGFTIQSDVMSAGDDTKEQEGIQVTDVSETSDKYQINTEPKRRKMGSTRKSQLNRKQQDEESNVEVSANSLVQAMMNEKDNTPTDDAQPLPSDTSVNQGEAELAADQHQSEESTFTHVELTQKGKEEIKDTDKEATIQTLFPLADEEIQPSSPGKRRKMGSTRKNVLSKSEVEVVTSISNDSESEKHSDSLESTATTHEPPPDEETPLSPQVNLEKSKSEPGETEPSPQNEAMGEDAAIARRRKMGSHRKPHSDQSTSQRGVTDSEESLLHPLGERRTEPPQQAQRTEVKDVDNKAVSSATAFSIKSDPGPMRDKISQQSSPPSTNVRRVQERIRISTGFDPRARRYEVVMIGDSSVGKTSFIQRAQSGKFSLDIPASIGMDSYKWIANVNGQNIVLHLWDTAGQERFRSMTKQIFHRAQAFLLMYDVTCTQTFAAVTYWANCIKDGAGESAVVLLLGNKSDCTERKVRREEGEILAEENSFAFMECSAATGENVIDALETVARLLCQKADSSSKSEEPLILRKPERNNKLGCC